MEQAVFYPTGPHRGTTCQTCSAVCCLDCIKMLTCHQPERCGKSHIINTTLMTCARRLTP